MQRAWLNEIDPMNGFSGMLEYIPGVSFFAKTTEGVLLKVNQNFLERFGFESEDDLIGKRDEELFPPSMTEHFLKDDREVIETKQPKLNIVEVFLNRQGLPDWYLTHKLPILSRSGEVIGVMGITRSHEGMQQALLPYSQITQAVEHIRQNYREKITVEELAQLVSLSTRQFSRCFMKAFSITAQQFIMKTRIQAACELLRNTEDDLAELAVRTGFYDQSSMTLQFRKHMGMTPRVYRKMHQKDEL